MYDPRPVWKRFLPGRPSVVMRVNIANDLEYIHIPKAETWAPEAVPFLEAALSAIQSEADSIYKNRKNK